MLTSRIAEWCASILGATSRDRGYPWRLAGLFALVACAAAPLVMRFGPAGAVPLGLLFAGILALGAEAFVARDRLWAVARRPLGDPKQRLGDPPERALAPTTEALRRLAVCVDDARRGNYAAANDLVPTIARDLLRPEEIALFEGVRAMISLGLGDEKRAAELAVLALPTGSEEIDRALGRLVIARAWRNDHRLEAIDRAWSDAGVEPSTGETLPRLRVLMKLRVEPAAIDGVSASDAGPLAEEARAIGDEELAGELEYRARESSSAYR